MIGCPSEHSSPPHGIDVSRANRAVCDVSEESVDVHFIFLCVVAGYAVTLNPNRQPAYIVERWLIRFQSARLILHGGFPELGSLKSASRFTVLCLPPLARMVTPVRGVSRPSLGNATCLNVTPTALLLRGGLCSLPQCVGVVVL